MKRFQIGDPAPSKGGVNRTFQIKERPPPPAPMKPRATELEHAALKFIGKDVPEPEPGGLLDARLFTPRQAARFANKVNKLAPEVRREIIGIVIAWGDQHGADVKELCFRIRTAPLSARIAPEEKADG